MSKKTYTLITTIIGAAATIACALISYFQPSHFTAIIASIGIGATAINEILLQFVDEATLARK